MSKKCQLIWIISLSITAFFNSIFYPKNVIAENVSSRESVSKPKLSVDQMREQVNDYIKENKNKFTEDMFINNLLLLPYEKRQYVFPYLHEQPFLSHKIKSHPQIIVWKGKKPTVIAPQMKAYAAKYLDDLPAVFYYFLDPDYWTGYTPFENTVSQNILNPDMPQLHAKSEIEIADYAVRSLSEIYQPDAETQKNFYQTDLTQSDIQRLKITLEQLNDFINLFPEKDSIPSLLRDLIRNRLHETISSPFEEWSKNINKLGLSDDLEKFLKNQGWQNTDEFIRKSDTMLRAVRVNRMSLIQAMSLSSMRQKYYPIEKDKPISSIQMYLRMYDAKPGDALFITPYADELKQTFEQGNFTRIGLPIYID